MGILKSLSTGSQMDTGREKDTRTHGDETCIMKYRTTGWTGDRWKLPHKTDEDGNVWSVWSMIHWEQRGLIHVSPVVGRSLVVASALYVVYLVRDVTCLCWWQMLGCMEMCRVAKYSPSKRRQIFCLTTLGAQPINWLNLHNVCVLQLRRFIDSLNSYQGHGHATTTHTARQ